MKALPIITEKPTLGIIMISKVAFLGLAVVSAAIHGSNLQSYLSYQGYHQLVEDVADGRQNPDDQSRISALLERPFAPSDKYDIQAMRTKAILQIYIVDLVAIEKGVNPFQPSSDNDMIAAREDAMARAKTTLSHTPLDGDLWLRMAVLAQSLQRPEEEILAYRMWSEQTTPFEGWIKSRRDALFPEG